MSTNSRTPKHNVTTQSTRPGNVYNPEKERTLAQQGEEYKQYLVEQQRLAQLEREELERQQRLAQLEREELERQQRNQEKIQKKIQERQDQYERARRPFEFPPKKTNGGKKNKTKRRKSKRKK
jgi:hypothetical protein